MRKTEKLRRDSNSRPLRFMYIGALTIRVVARRGYRKKMDLLKISRFPDFTQCLPDSSQRFLDLSLTKLFKVCKCVCCGSLNPRLSCPVHMRIKYRFVVISTLREHIKLLNDYYIFLEIFHYNIKIM